jgi:hypothetical protein
MLHINTVTARVQQKKEIMFMILKELWHQEELIGDKPAVLK